MAEISLRSYTREIDRLIEQEKLDEAIAHCRHILQNYPKYIECYRLLGKAYLEAKRYGDSADIFQRVLSAVPDDFVSHIGMSIVREDEGNLESSIWHMERAFETNPANPALQQELKRLIGRRDGFEPHKVRLTRGALARMYAHGELYPQAIAELQSALQEEHDRPDLQVLLTDMYWQTEQRTEAAEIAGRILEKLPFCLKALRVTAAVLQERGKLEEAAAYHRRLAQLDPYLAYIEMPMAESSRVEAETIELDRLSWQPGQPLPAAEGGPTDWAASLGLDEEGEAGPGAGPLPSWLSDIEVEAGEGEEETQEPTALPFKAPEEPVAAEPSPEGAIPDWMEDAGWSEATGQAEEGPVSFSADELDSLERGEIPAEAPEEAETGELAPAEIPSWLQEKAPDQATAGQEEDEAELAAILGASVEESPEQPSAAEEEPEQAAAGTTDVPGWLDEGEPGATSTIMTWLGDRESDEGPTAEADDQLPDWIQETTPDFGQVPESQPAASDEQDVPGWLSGVAQAAAEAGDTEELELEQFRQQIEPGPSDEPAPSQTGDVPGWLQAITGEEPERPEPAEQAEITPESDAAADVQEPTAEVDATEPKAEGAPEWLAGVAADGPETPAEEGAAEEEQLAGPEGEVQAAVGGSEETASWLEQLGSDETAIAAQESAEPVPDWMAGLDEEGEGPSESDVDDLASTWLEGLSETLSETPAEPPPGGVQADADIPDWLGEVGEAESDKGTTPQAGAVQQGPSGPTEGEGEDLSWLTDLESQVASGGSADGELAPAAADIENLDEEDIFNWLDQLATQQDTDESLGAQASVEESETAADLSEKAPPESLEEGLEWLDRLSESRGIDADISRQPAAGTPSEDTQPSGQEPSQPSAEFAAEAFNVWEPEQPDEAEPAPPVMPEPSEETAGPQDLEPERPTAEKSASIFDELIEEDAAGREPAETEPIEELYTGEEIDFELAPAPDSIFDAQGVEAMSSPAAGEPITPEAEGGQEELEPALPEDSRGPEPETASPASEEEEVPEWLKAHFDSAAVEEEAVSEPETVEPEPVAPQPIEDVEPAEPALVPGPSEPEAEGPEPPGPEQPQADVTVEGPVAEEEPTEEPAAAAEPTAGEPIGQTQPEVTEIPEQPKQVEKVPTEPEPAAAIEPVVEAEAPAEAEPGEAAVPEPLDATLVAAREALAEGDQGAALANYNRLIKGRRELENVVADLEAALEGEPDAPMLWQSLGDAYMQQGRTKQAVQAYNRGMEEAEVLDNARQALAFGDLDRATTQYGMLIKKGKRVDEIIEDLENAVEGEQDAPSIWQLLGDAYMKADRLNDSIEAYRRGMDSV
jgi:tetratricopeptide (TPR) repeat protein